MYLMILDLMRVPHDCTKSSTMTTWCPCGSPPFSLTMRLFPSLTCVPTIWTWSHLLLVHTYSMSCLQSIELIEFQWHHPYWYLDKVDWVQYSWKMLKLLMEAFPCSFIWKCCTYLQPLWELIQQATIISCRFLKLSSPAKQPKISWNNGIWQ